MRVRTSAPSSSDCAEATTNEVDARTGLWEDAVSGTERPLTHRGTNAGSGNRSRATVAANCCIRKPWSWAKTAGDR